MIPTAHPSVPPHNWSQRALTSHPSGEYSYLRHCEHTPESRREPDRDECLETIASIRFALAPSQADSDSDSHTLAAAHLPTSRQKRPWIPTRQEPPRPFSILREDDVHLPHYRQQKNYVFLASWRHDGIGTSIATHLLVRPQSRTRRVTQLWCTHTPPPLRLGLRGRRHAGFSRLWAAELHREDRQSRALFCVL